MTISGVISSVRRVDFAATADRPARVAVSLTLVGEDAQGRMTEYEMLTDDPGIVGKVIRRDADGRTQTAAQAAKATQFEGGSSSLLLHQAGIVTLTGVAAGERRAVGENPRFVSRLSPIGEVTAEVRPLPARDPAALAALLA